LAGDTETGVTIMQMDAGLDTGPVLLEKRLAIQPEDDAASLHATLAALGAQALLEALTGLEAGRLVPRPQAVEGVTYAAKIEKTEARIDWQDDAVAIARRVRAFQPWPVAETSWRGEQLRVHRARALAGEPATTAVATTAPSATPGLLLGLCDDMLVVACGRGRLGILELQRAGRRSLGAREFAHGLQTTDEVFI
jgi:methionyl-tRNA formyltransferase